MPVFRSDESGYSPSIEGLRDFGNAGRYNPITPSPSLPACLCSRLVHGSTRSHYAREPVGPAVSVSPSARASSPEAARPSPQEASPPPSAPRAPPGHTMALRVRVGVCVYVLAGSGMCGTMCACLLLCVRVSGLMCHSVVFIFSSISIALQDFF